MNIIDNRLGIPDPALVPPHVMSHLLPKDVIDRYHETGYIETNYGSIGARNAVIDRLKMVNPAIANDATLSGENVVITSGATHATTCALRLVHSSHAQLESQEVLLLEPGYNLYKPQIKESGFTIRSANTNHLNGMKRDEYEQKLLELIDNSITPETTLFILTDPDNPTGRVYSNSFKKGLLSLLERHSQLHIVSDTVYSEIRRCNGMKSDTLFALSNPKQRNRIYEVNAISKSFLPGARGGWLITSQENVQKIDGPLDYMYGQLSIGGQLSIISALSKTSSIIPNYYRELNRIYDLRTHYVVDRMNQVQGLDLQIPEGSFYVFVDFSKFSNKISSYDIVDQAKKQGVLLSYGKKFGAPNAIRINAARPIKELEIVTRTIHDILQSKGVQVHPQSQSVPSIIDDKPKYNFKPYSHSLGTIHYDAYGPQIIQSEPKEHHKVASMKQKMLKPKFTKALSQASAVDKLLQTRDSSNASRVR